MNVPVPLSQNNKIESLPTEGGTDRHAFARVVYPGIKRNPKP